MSDIKGLKIIRTGRDIKFEYDGQVDATNAMIIQLEAGYHPNGYGFYQHRISNGKTYWSCADCCD